MTTTDFDIPHVLHRIWMDELVVVKCCCGWGAMVAGEIFPEECGVVRKQKAMEQFIVEALMRAAEEVNREIAHGQEQWARAEIALAEAYTAAQMREQGYGAQICASGNGTGVGGTEGGPAGIDEGRVRVTRRLRAVGPSGVRWGSGITH